MVDGWFSMPGRKGPRTLAEQMTGLDKALAEAPGKTVLDLGCAEGLIAMEFAKAGANQVLAIDCNAELINAGRKLQHENPQLSKLKLEHADIQRVMAYPVGSAFSIVLALAILHKLPDPEGALHWCADIAEDLLVIRLQGGSRGIIRDKKHPHREVDSRMLADLGYELELETQGPRDELVHYWRKWYCG